MTEANVGRSPKPSNAAATGTWARRIAALPLRPTVITFRSPSCAVICSAAKRIVLVLSEPARPRSVVMQHDRARAALALGKQRVVLLAEHRGQIGEHLVHLVRVGPRLERGVLGALQLRRRHELHRAGDLLDVAHRAYAASDLALAGQSVA